MGISLKLCDMNLRFKEREKNNCIYFEGSFISSAEYVLYGDGAKLGYILDIKDKANIPKDERSACGINRKIPGTAKFALVREFETKVSPNPDTEVYTMLPARGLQEAIPTSNCCYIPVEEIKDVAYSMCFTWTKLEQASTIQQVLTMPSLLAGTEIQAAD